MYIYVCPRSKVSSPLSMGIHMSYLQSRTVEKINGHAVGEFYELNS